MRVVLFHLVNKTNSSAKIRSWGEFSLDVLEPLVLFMLCDLGAAESNLFARDVEVLHDNQGSLAEELSVRLSIRYSTDLLNHA